MARAKASSTKSATSPAKSGAIRGRDRTIDVHNAWLNYLKPVSLGLVFSPNALRVAQVELPWQAPEDQRRFGQALHADGDASELDAPVRPGAIDIEAFLLRFLGWRADLVDWFAADPATRMFVGQGGQPPITVGGATRRAVPDALRHQPKPYLEVLEPSFSLRWPTLPAGASEPGAEYALIGLELPAGVDLDRRPTERDAGDDLDWVESPQKKFERLMYESRVEVGLIVSPSAVRLVYRPEGQQSGYITWPVAALVAPGGRLACTALASLLSHPRLFTLPTRQRLHGILSESRKFQNTVTNELKDQVMAALFALLRGIEVADEDEGKRLLAGIRTNPARTVEIYEGLLTILMRLVFLLYAEEREMFPGDDLFSRNYALGGLFARLVEDESRHPDTMDQRYGAWGHLVSLFRLVHAGATYETGGHRVVIPPRQGNLFDPTRFPFLDGLPPDEAEAKNLRPLPSISDGVVLRVLRNLLYLGQERLSYRSLEVEQIGSVYEAIMGYRVEAAAGRSVAIRPEKRSGAPVTINLDELLATPATKRAKWFRDITDRDLGKGAKEGVATARSIEALVAVLGKLVDDRLTPSAVRAGSLVIQPSRERRRSGSHYTPRALTEPIVRKALEPILARLGERPTPEAIEALKVCDPAMGSGAFLVEAMRQLAKLLVQAWQDHPPTDLRIPPDETPELFASRRIAQRCLYGVDKNPMAVNLAKLSLWLATLARDHAFTFLDHNLRTGDSLIGLTLAQVQACQWAHDLSNSVRLPVLERLLTQSFRDRNAIRTATDLTSYLKLNELRRSADGWLDQIRLVGDATLGVFFAGGSAKTREQSRKDTYITVCDWASPTNTAETKLALSSIIRGDANSLTTLDPPLKPFHWELEFSEVFLEIKSNGMIARNLEKGFDVIVGNPPFAGKNAIAQSINKLILEWGKTGYIDSHGNSDLVAFFFSNRSRGILRP